MQVDDLSRDRLRRLASLRPEKGLVLSVYLNLDPARFPTGPERASELGSMRNRATEAIRRQDGLPHYERKALWADLERVEEFFGTFFSANGAQGIALFACGPSGLFEVVRLAQPITTRAMVDDSPFIEPLVELGAPEEWAVVLISRMTGRVLRGSPRRLVEVLNFTDDVHRAHRQGGLAASRYRRGIEHQVHLHVANVARQLLRSFERKPFKRLLISTKDELWVTVEQELNTEVRRRLAGRFDCDIERASADEILEACRPAMAEAEKQARHSLVLRLEQGLGTGEGVAAGLDATLDALVQRRVESLLVKDDFAPPGYQCARCGWLGASGDRCPIDSSPVEYRDTIIEPAVESALLQSAAVEFFDSQDGPSLADCSGIAALLRF